MPRKPTGKPTGRPPGSGVLGEVKPLTVRLPTPLYQKLELFAEGRAFHRGVPELSGCVRELLEYALAGMSTHRLARTPAYSNSQTVSDSLQETENGTTGEGEEIQQTVSDSLQKTVSLPPALDYDPHKYKLGSPCKAAGHLSHGDRGNLRGIISGVCAACEDAKKATKAQAVPLPPPATVALDAMPGASVAISQQPPQPALDYDQTKYVLGKLCPGKHAYQDTGQTLLTAKGRRCLLCEAEKKREKRAAQRQ